MSQLRFLIENFERAYREAREAEKNDELQEARRGFLQAAQFLFQAAAATPEEDDKLRSQRKTNAQKLLDKAKSLRTRLERPDPALAADPEGGEETGFVALEKPDVDFSQIAGLEDAKEQIRLRMIYPFQNNDLANLYGIQRGGGMLLWGPPGTGKTLLARAVAGEIQVPFFSVKPSEIMSKFVGEAEKNVQKLFETARQQPLSVIFIDEVEALVPRRAETQSNVMTRVVPQILAELEGVDSAGKNPLLFIGATNEPWSLDPAVTRPGRFDVKVYVGLPDQPARLKILQLNLDKRPLAAELDLEDFARQLDGYSGADIRNICQTAAQKAFLEALNTGATVLIDREALDAARGRPSVSPQDLERFQAYQARSWS